jgi:hypothetical protein
MSDDEKVTQEAVEHLSDESVQAILRAAGSRSNSVAAALEARGLVGDPAPPVEEAAEELAEEVPAAEAPGADATG